MHKRKDPSSRTNFYDVIIALNDSFIGSGVFIPFVAILAIFLSYSITPDNLKENFLKTVTHEFKLFHLLEIGVLVLGWFFNVKYVINKSKVDSERKSNEIERLQSKLDQVIEEKYKPKK